MGGGLQKLWRRLLRDTTDSDLISFTAYLSKSGQYKLTTIVMAVDLSWLLQPSKKMAQDCPKPSPLR